MKRVEKLKFLSSSIILIGLTFLLINGCEKNMPFEETQSVISDPYVDLNAESHNPVASVTYPLSGSVQLNYDLSVKGYEGGMIKLADGSKFRIKEASLTSPAGFDQESVNIEMQVDKDLSTGELIYTFGPSGCSFSPSALVVFDYTALNTNNPVLYYIQEDGDYIQQSPNYIDVKNKKIWLYIDHFSRYAVAYGR